MAEHRLQLRKADRNGNQERPDYMAKLWKDRLGGSEEAVSIPASIFDEKKRIRPEIVAISICDANDRKAFEIALGSVGLVFLANARLYATSLASCGGKGNIVAIDPF